MARRLVLNNWEFLKDKAHLVVPMPFAKKRIMEDFDENSKKSFWTILKVAE